MQVVHGRTRALVEAIAPRQRAHLVYAPIVGAEQVPWMHSKRKASTVVMLWPSGWPVSRASRRNGGDRRGLRPPRDSFVRPGSRSR